MKYIWINPVIESMYDAEELIPSLDKGTHGRRRINFAFCGVTFAPRTSSTCRSSALQSTKFISSRLYDLSHRYFRHWQGIRGRRTGRTLTEDNTANGENIMV